MAVAVVALSVLCGWYAVNLAMGRLADNSAGWLDSLEPVHGQWVSRTGFAEDGSTPWTTPVRVTLDGDELRFDVGCNRLSAIVTVEDHRLHSEQGVVATEIGCPPEVAATEAWLVALVADSAQVQLKGSTEGEMFSLDTDAGWIGFLRDPGPATRAVDSVAGANRRCARGAVRCVLNTGSHQWLHRVVHPGTPQIGRVDRRRQEALGPGSTCAALARASDGRTCSMSATMSRTSGTASSTVTSARAPTRPCLRRYSEWG